MFYQVLIIEGSVQVREDYPIGNVGIVGTVGIVPSPSDGLSVPMVTSSSGSQIILPPHELHSTFRPE